MTPISTSEETPSIGRTLKACREGKNISVNDIASKMYLDVRIINAIEEDNFSSLSDAIYVRGYIRSYSKLLGADADGLVKLYEQHGGNFEPEIIPEIRHPSQTSSSDKPVKAFTYLIALTLVVLVIAWWQSNFVINTPVDNTTSITSALSVQPVTPDIAELTTPQPSYTSTDTSSVNNQILNTAETLTVVTPLPEQGATTSAQPTVYQTTGPDLIVLKLTADSWIEIVDATNTKVFFNLGRPGDVYNVRGKAPFNVLLGFAQAVNIEYNGNPFNAAPFSRAGVARFTLGQ